MYKFNNVGLRDSDWTENIEDFQKGIFAIGDSGSIGMGIPYDYVWTTIVEKNLNLRVYKLMRIEGCNVSWIFNNTKDILERVKPKLCVIQWTYAWRNNLKKKEFSWNPDKQDEEILLNLIKRVEELKGNTKIYHIIVEEIFTRQLLKQIKKLPINALYLDETKVVDHARDNIHYGVNTHKNVADNIAKYIHDENINIW
jgi:hypothetical protein